MSDALNPAPVPTPAALENLPDDLIVLEQEFKALRSRFENRKFIPPTGATEVEIARAHDAYQQETQELIRAQIAIAARMRRTAAGPAKAGGKRTKAAKAKPDLDSILNIG